jgi:Bacterial regulatory proteins, luxR family
MRELKLLQRLVAGLARNEGVQSKRTEILQRLKSLSPREVDVLCYVLGGQLNREIAAELGVTEKNNQSSSTNRFCFLLLESIYCELLDKGRSWKLEPISGFAEIGPWPEPVDTDYLLHDISTLIRRQVALGQTPARRRSLPHPPAWVAASPTDTPPPPVQSRIGTAAACKRDRTA